MVQEYTEIASEFGRFLDEEQRLAVDVLTGRTAQGMPATSQAGIVCARQNLKTFVMETIVLCTLIEPDLPIEVIGWTAHRFDATSESFRHFKKIIDNYDFIRRRVKKLGESHGNESIEFTNGRRLLFKARSQSALRAFSMDCIIFDEAFALTPEQVGSMVPSMSARPWAWSVYGSSAGKVTSEVLRGVRDAGRAGGVGAPAYIEWGAPGGWARPGCASRDCTHVRNSRGCALDRLENLQAANPALGKRITMERIQEERATMTPAQFGLERLSWWEDPLEGGGESPIPTWSELEDEDSELDAVAPITIGVDVSPDGRMGAVVVAGRTATGLTHVELVAHRPGADWIPGVLRRLTDRFPVDAMQLPGTHEWVPAVLGDAKVIGPIMPSISMVNVPMTLLSTSQVAMACAGLQHAVNGKRLAHIGQQEVTDAVAGAGRRTMGDSAWIWSKSRSEADISPLYALTLAHWGHGLGGSGHDVSMSAY